MNKTLYEQVAKVNGYSIDKMKGSKGFYNLRIDSNKYMTFRTKKAAIEMARKMGK